MHSDEDPPYGEVYVVAVNPKAAGRGLGTVLTRAGLQHLRDQGLDSVLLYVDGDNDPAVAVYSGGLPRRAHRGAVPRDLHRARLTRSAESG